MLNIYESLSFEYQKENTAFFKISDLHFFHKNILIYNLETRKKLFSENLKSKLSGNIENDKKTLQEYLNSLSEEDLYEELFYIGQKLLQYLYGKVNIFSELNKGKQLYYVDLGDTFFHISSPKLEKIRNSTFYQELHKFYSYLSSLGFKKLLVCGNHDVLYKDEYVEFYSHFFDCISKSYCFTDKKSQTIEVFTHIPLGTSYLKESYKDEKRFVKNYEIDLLNDLYYKFISGEYKTIIGNYGHMHDNYLVNSKMGINGMTDFGKDKTTNLEMFGFLDYQIELNQCCFDYIESENKQKRKHHERIESR